VQQQEHAGRCQPQVHLLQYMQMSYKLSTVAAAAAGKVRVTAAQCKQDLPPAQQQNSQHLLLLLSRLPYVLRLEMFCSRISPWS
jgi:hypothetical protein